MKIKNIFYKIMDPSVLWDWFDFALMFRIYKPIKSSKYYLCIDIQIAWFNLWVQLFKK